MVRDVPTSAARCRSAFGRSHQPIVGDDLGGALGLWRSRVRRWRRSVRPELAPAPDLVGRHFSAEAPRSDPASGPVIAEDGELIRELTLDPSRRLPAAQPELNWNDVAGHVGTMSRDITRCPRQESNLRHTV